MSAFSPGVSPVAVATTPPTGGWVPSPRPRSSAPPGGPIGAVALVALGLAIAAAVAGCTRSGDSAVAPTPTPGATAADATDDAIPASTPTPTARPTATVTVVPDEPDDELAGRWSWTDAPCAFNEPGSVAVRCGWLEVPERWDLPGGGTIRLHVGVFSAGPNDAEPVVYLEGGPGGDPLSASSFSFDQFFSGIVTDRDVVIVAQRGTGPSEPSLQCDESLEVDIDMLDERLTPAESAERSLDALRSCAERLRADGVDLGAFNSVQSAHDLEALRRALDVERWHLLGVSYGTRLAQTIMRLHPDGIASVVLDSAVPIDRDPQADVPRAAQRAFDTLFAGCAASPVCNGAYPDLERRWFAQVDRLDAEPVSFEAVDALTGDRYDVVADGDDLMALGFSALYSDSSFAALPELVRLLEQGDTSGLATLVGIELANAEFVAVGSFWAVECHEEVPFTDAAALARGRTGNPRYDMLGGADVGAELARVCDVFDAGRADPVENQPVTSDLPVLVLSGIYDPITPPEGGQGLAEQFPNATYVLMPFTGHGVVAQPCGQTIIAGFLAEPGAPVDQSCAMTVPEPAWVPDLFSEVTFAPFSYDADLFGATGVAPVGWEAGFDGTFSRADNVLRSSVIVEQVLSGVPKELVVNQLGTLGVDGARLTETFEVGDRTWEHYVIDVPGSIVDVYVAADGGDLFLVLLQHAPVDRDAAVATLVEPMLAAIAP